MHLRHKKMFQKVRSGESKVYEVCHDEDDVRTGHQVPINHLHYHKHPICNSISICLVFIFIHSIFEWNNLKFRYFIVCLTSSLPVSQSLKSVYDLSLRQNCDVMHTGPNLYVPAGWR